jgi:c-di-GMP-binding flagellar brake protein YcgR
MKGEGEKMPADENGRPAKPTRLGVALGTVMLATFFNETRALKGLYVGQEAGGYVILRFPASAPIEDHLYEGNRLVIKFIADGTVFGFQSQVMGYVYKKKLILVVLSYPESVETHVLRESQRVDFLVPAVLQAAGQSIEGIVVDLSAGGCRFRFDPSQHSQPPDFNQAKNVTVSFQIVGREGVHDFGCTVMNQTPMTGGIALGLRFDQVADEVTEGIRDYVTQVSRHLVG